jgi:hypothetical protein
VKYLGELYNYRVVESPVIFDTLYTIITFGHGMSYEAWCSEPYCDTQNLVDLPASAFLHWMLLQTSFAFVYAAPYWILADCALTTAVQRKSWTIFSSSYRFVLVFAFCKASHSPVRRQDVYPF